MILPKARHIPEFDLTLIDADSLMYMIAWGTINQKVAERALKDYVQSIIESVDAPVAEVFIKGDNNFRYLVDPEYKAQRKDNLAEDVKDRVALLYSYARKHYTQSHNGEADDYLSICAYEAMAEEKQVAICHIDKDLNMIPGWHYNFKKKEYYYMTPEESFTFMCRQLLSGDMQSDNIPGLHKVGETVAAGILHNCKLSGMKERIISVWREQDRPIARDLDRSRYPTPELRYKRFLDSANCLILREERSELRALTEEELLKKMEWNDPETDYLFHKDNDVSAAILLNSLPINCNVEGGPAKCPKPKRVLTATGATPQVSKSTPKNTSDSSTESPSS